MTAVIHEVKGNISYVRLNRPDSLNAIEKTLLDGLLEVFENIQNCRKTRVVILSGEGRGFCAGADLATPAGPGDIPGTEGMQMLGFIYKFQERIARAVLAIHECDKPVIAAVHGACVGGGLAFALGSDLRIATPEAKFGSVFIKTGLSSCDVGTSYFLPRLIPPTKAMELMATGRKFSGEEADHLGLLNACVPQEELMARAEALAAEIAENSEFGVWMTKKGFWNNLDVGGLRQAMEIENRTQALGTFSGCIEESINAFAEGRKPQWKPL